MVSLCIDLDSKLTNKSRNNRRDTANSFVIQVAICTIVRYKTYHVEQDKNTLRDTYNS